MAAATCAGLVAGEYLAGTKGMPVDALARRFHRPATTGGAKFPDHGVTVDRGDDEEGRLGAVAVAPAAHADAQDTTFLNAVASMGINTDQPEALISFAHMMCDVEGGPAVLGPWYGLMASRQLSDQQAARVAAAGTKVYCPDNPCIARTTAIFQILSTPGHL